MANTSRVLVIGLDPRAVGDLVVDADAVVAALAHGQARFDAAGIPAEVCLVGLDPVRATDQIVEQLCAQEYACVVIGGGIRKPEQLLELFETVINLVRKHAPGAAIAFNTNPADSLDAARRWLPAPDSRNIG
jgi:putative intracellular protease/amidase